MSEPFSFLDEDDENAEGGIAWLPITLAGIALAGFLSIPLFGLLKPNHEKVAQEAEWSEPILKDAIPVSIESLVDEPQPIEEEVVARLERAEKRRLPLRVDIPASAFQTAKVPPLDKKSAPATKNATSKSKPSGPTYDYVVQPKDTLYGIARKTRSTPDAIASASAIKKSDPIKPGQVLKIPGKEPVNNPTQVASKPPVKKSTRPRDEPARIKPPLDPVAQPRDQVAARRPDAPAQPNLYPALRRPNPPAKPKPTVAQQPKPRKPIVAQPKPATAPPPQPRRPLIARPKPAEPVAQRKPNPPVRPPEFVPVVKPPSVPAIPQEKGNPLDKYDHAIAYRVQTFDSMSRIANAHATTPAELIELNGRDNVKRGEMLIVPVDSCLVKKK